MIESIIDDVKRQFAYGNMISKLILVNIFVFLLVVIIKAFTGYNPNIYESVISFLALPSDLGTLLTRPWTLLTYMFLHQGFWHIFWNMVWLYWFGRIIGDLLGDKRMLPLYIMGGLAGGLLFLIYSNLAGDFSNVRGASGAVSCLVIAAAVVAPNYVVRLILIGDVQIKYIALFRLVMDLISISEHNNVGGNMAHIGGAAMGAFFVYMLRQGRDLSDISWTNQKKPTKMKVIHNKKRPKPQAKTDLHSQDRVDQILDKINATGYDSLTREEKEILYQASKKD